MMSGSDLYSTDLYSLKFRLWSKYGQREGTVPPPQVWHRMVTALLAKLHSCKKYSAPTDLPLNLSRKFQQDEPRPVPVTKSPPHSPPLTRLKHKLLQGIEIS